MTTPIDCDVAASTSALSVPAPAGSFELSRRRFLQGVLAGTAAAATLHPSFDALAAAASPIGPSDGILVLVTMDGGNDNLSTFVPVNDSAYRDARGSLALGAGSTLAMTHDRRLHPHLKYLAGRWAQGDVAVVEGVGNPRVDLSHFSAMADHMHGRPSSGIPTSGWLGRWLDEHRGNPFAGVSIGSRLPLVARGAANSAVVLPAYADFVARTSSLPAGIEVPLERLGGAPTGLGGLGDLVASVTAGAFDASGDLSGLYGGSAPGALATPMALAARLVNANVGVRVITVQHLGYDSHAAQSGMHGTRLAELDAGLAAFFSTLSPTWANRTMVLCTSEFGRRVRVNGSAGTDHGAGGAAFAVGSAVRGGFYGQLGSLTNLTAEGNQRHVFDYRTLYGTVLTDWLDGDGAGIVGTGVSSIGFTGAPGVAGPGSPQARARTLTPSEADVLRLYRAFFNREPDTAGARYWIDQHARGQSLDAIAEYFTLQTEFTSAYAGTSNHEYLTRVYRNVLGRNADPSGFAYWLGMLDSRRLSRGGVVRWVAANDEFRNRYPYTRLP